MTSTMMRGASGGARIQHNGYTASRTAVIGLAKVLFLGLAQISSVAASPIGNFLHVTHEHHDTPTDTEDPSLWLYLGIALVLVLLGGAFAGLTIALMGQDGIYLQVIATSGEGKEQKHAQRVYNLLNRGKHWVLVTLLLSNVIVNETLPIVLDRSLGGGWPAVLGSTVLIVIFGEVIPQSVCVRYGLQIGAFMTPFVLALMYLLAPIAWPTAKLLDRLLGQDHGTVYKKTGLKTLVALHKTLGTTPGDRLNQDEVTIISAVLDLKDKAVGDIMTPIEDVFTLPSDARLDEDMMDEILRAGYSRIPIHVPGNDRNFIGMLLVKILITYDPEDAKRVSEFALATLPETRPETSCLDIVNFFQEGKSHMVLVSEYPGENYGATGVVTLEDVIEELIGEEIIDESDVYIDVHKAIRRMVPAPKSRVAKGTVIVDPDAPIPPEAQESSEDLESGPLGIARKRLESFSSQSRSPARFAPNSTTFMRRSSSAMDGQAVTPVAVRGNALDMKEHLKHLGPSNLASRPKSTRYNTVKIKQGLNVATSEQDGGKAHSISEEPYHDEPYKDDPAPHGGEGEGLLKSAGREASDGVQALHQGYGTNERSTSPSKSRKDDLIDFEDPADSPSTTNIEATTTESNVTDIEANATIAKANGKNEVKNRSPVRPTARKETAHNPVGSNSNTSESGDTLSRLPSQSPEEGPKKRRKARSGSITENIVDSGGVRKVVLQTTSSSDDEREAEEAKEGALGTQPSKNVSSSFSNLLDGGGNRGGEASAPVDDNAAETAAAGKKKKKPRKRHGKKKVDENDAPGGS